MDGDTAVQVRDINNMPATTNWIWQNSTSIYDTTQLVDPDTTYYIYCFQDDTIAFNFVSYVDTVQALLTGLSGLEGSLGPILGGPMIILFVVMLAGQATGRTAPTFIIIVVAAIGILMGLGFFAISEGVFGMILIMASLGVLIGKKFL